MTIRIQIKHIEAAGEPAFIDVHYRKADGSVIPTLTRTYTLEPGETREVAVYYAQVLVVREGPEIVQGEG